MFVVDLCTSSLIGLVPPKIVRSQARRLNTMILGVETRYLRVLEEMMARHNMVPKLTAVVSKRDKDECKAIMDAVVAEETQHRRHTEKNATTSSLAESHSLQSLPSGSDGAKSMSLPCASMLGRLTTGLT